MTKMCFVFIVMIMTVSGIAAQKFHGTFFHKENGDNKTDILISKDGNIYEVTCGTLILDSMNGMDVEIIGSKLRNRSKDYPYKINATMFHALITGKPVVKKSKSGKERPYLQFGDDKCCGLLKCQKTSLIQKHCMDKDKILLWCLLRFNKRGKLYLMPQRILKEAKVSLPQGPEYDNTDNTLPEDKLKSNSGITIDLPELGNSARSNGRNAIQMFVHLPENYSPNTAHPVIFHMGGGRGNPGEVMGWNNIVKGKNFILVGADYSYDANNKAGLLKYGTCRDFDSKIAAHCIQILKNSTLIDDDTIILSGLSSGAYSITDCLNHKTTLKIFDGFCAIIGGSDPKGAKIGDRPFLFVFGEKDTQRFASHRNKSRMDWMQEAYKRLQRGKCNVQLYLQKGVGHSWSRESYPVQRKWLYSQFPHIRKYFDWADVCKDTDDPCVKQTYEKWIRESGFDTTAI